MVSLFVVTNLIFDKYIRNVFTFAARPLTVSVCEDGLIAASRKTETVFSVSFLQENKTREMPISKSDRTIKNKKKNSRVFPLNKKWVPERTHLYYAQ